MPLNSHEKHEEYSGQRLGVVPRPVWALAMKEPLLKQLLPCLSWSPLTITVGARNFMLQTMRDSDGGRP